MTKPAKNYDDDGLDVTMTLKDYLEIIDTDIDEAADSLEIQSELDQLVRFLRSKADEIAGIELDPEEECEQDEEDALE